MKIRIIKCSDSMYWYKDKIGETYQVRRIDNDSVWVRPEDDPYAGWNFIKLIDLEEYKEIE